MSTPACWFLLGPALILVGGLGLAAVQIGVEIVRDRRRLRRLSTTPPATGHATLA